LGKVGIKILWGEGKRGSDEKTHQSKRTVMEKALQGAEIRREIWVQNLPDQTENSASKKKTGV